MKTYIGGITSEKLAKLLKDAKEAHTEYETTNPPKHDWTDWYAEHIVNALNETQRNVKLK